MRPHLLQVAVKACSARRCRRVSALVLFGSFNTSVFHQLFYRRVAKWSDTQIKLHDTAAYGTKLYCPCYSRRALISFYLNQPNAPHATALHSAFSPSAANTQDAKQMVWAIAIHKWTQFTSSVKSAHNYIHSPFVYITYKHAEQTWVRLKAPPRLNPKPRRFCAAYFLGADIEGWTASTQQHIKSRTSAAIQRQLRAWVLTAYNAAFWAVYADDTLRLSKHITQRTHFVSVAPHISVNTHDQREYIKFYLASVPVCSTSNQQYTAKVAGFRCPQST